MPETLDRVPELDDVVLPERPAEELTPPRDLPEDTIFSEDTALPGDSIAEPAGSATTRSPNDLDLLDERPSANEADSMPATELPATNLDDLFGDAPQSSTDRTDALDEAPTQESPAADNLDDLFGEPSMQPDTGADETDEGPAPGPLSADNLDDLFGDSPEQPGNGSAPALDQPPSQQPSSDLDDLFGDPGGQAAANGTPASQREPSAGEEMDDLFGGSTDSDTILPGSTQPNSTGGEDIFGGTPDVRVADQAGTQATDDLDDLFGTPLGDEANEPLPETEPAPAEDGLDDLFNGSASAPASVRREETVATPSARAVDVRLVKSVPLLMRHWTDNTGTYTTTARLVVVADNHVRLFKDNGRYTTVPIRRLSQADEQYVREHAADVQDPTVEQVAGR